MVVSPTLRKEHCSICGIEFSMAPPNSGGGLVEFKETKTDADWNRGNGGGRPGNVGSFCTAHYGDAYKLRARTLAEAIKMLREKK